MARIDPLDLFIAVLDAPVSRGRARREELDHSFEPYLPGGSRGMHRIYQPLQSGRVLAIAFDEQTIKSLDPAVTVATPDRWPDRLRSQLESELPARSINLLRGPAETARVRRARAMLTYHAVAALVAVSAVASLIMQDAISSSKRQTLVSRTDTREVQLAALGPAATNSRQPLAGLLLSELRRLRATRDGNVVSNEDTDRSEADRLLAALLEAWPTDIQARVESLSIAPRSVDLALTVPDLSQADAFATQMAEIPGVIPGTQSTARDREDVRLTVRMNRRPLP